MHLAYSLLLQHAVRDLRRSRRFVVVLVIVYDNRGKVTSRVLDAAKISDCTNARIESRRNYTYKQIDSS